MSKDDPFWNVDTPEGLAYAVDWTRSLQPTSQDERMILTEQQRKEFEAITRPVIKWLNDNCHPHVTVVIDPTSAELSEGIYANTTHEFVRD